MRLDFYENWLTSEGLRDGSIGLAPMQGVLGFLRTEGAAYDRVMVRAGQLAAEWSLLSLPAGRRRFVSALPRWFRVRAALRLVREIALSISSGSAVKVRVKGRSARVEFASSVFCLVRDVQPAPLCAFYRSLVAYTLQACAVPAGADVHECRAMGATLCVIRLDLSVSEQLPEAAAAA
jgi:hypothetical protein